MEELEKSINVIDVRLAERQLCQYSRMALYQHFHVVPTEISAMADNVNFLLKLRPREGIPGKHSGGLAAIAKWLELGYERENKHICFPVRP